MSALSDLVYGKGQGPWPHFTDKYPVKVKQITGMCEAVQSDGSSLNDQLERDIDSIKKLNLNIEAILETHVHADHITAAYQLKKITTAPIYYGSESGVEGSDYLLDDNETLSIGNFEIKTLHTPGHTKESVTYYCCGMLFTGDTLFIGSSGRTDFQGGDPGMLYDSITKILL